MSFKINKHILLISAVLFILVMIPYSFAEVSNETQLTDGGTTVDENTIYVSNSENEGDGSQDNPYNSVLIAVENYNSSKNSNIYINNGNYQINSQIELNKDLTIVGQSREGTVLDAQNQNSIFKISSNSKVNLINLTLKNAKNSAIFLDSYTASNICIDNCIFEDNDGSAIYYKATFTGTNTLIDIKHSIFNSNYNTDGGAIYIYGGKSLNITDSRFENNRAPVGENDVSNGGAIYGAGNIKDIYINTCIFTNNTAVRGSAISQYCAGNLYVSNSRFTNNTSPGSVKYNINSSVIYDEQSNPNELLLYLNNNVLEDNSLNDEIIAKGNVNVEYLDKNTKLATTDLNKIYGDDYDFIVTLTDLEGNPLAGKTITVNLTNIYDNTVTEISNITDSQGRAIISLKAQKPGKYSAKTIFAGDSGLDSNIKTNNIFIRTENEYNMIFEENNIHITEGDSYNATLYVYDEYLIPTRELDGNSLSIDWYDDFGKHLAIQVNSVKVTNGKIVYDINRLHLITRDDPYDINFNIASFVAVLTVDLSINLSNIDPSLDTLYVSQSRGDDENGDGSKLNPLATLQKALNANYKLNCGKTIILEEGIYEISTFNVLGNVTIIGEKSKSILKQTNGVLGMLEIANGNIVKLANLTFTDGYATPSPDSLIHVADDSVAYIEECEFYNNSAVEGGAISISTGGSVFINNSYFHDNKAILGRNGGVIYADRGYLYISNTIFSNNTAGDGGVIYLGFPSEASIINTTFINNTALGSSSTAGSGGAIFTRTINLTVENTTFIENFADNGGAIFIDYGAVYIYKSYFENNNVRYSGVTKGSAIEGSSLSYTNITMHYSILINDNDFSYLVYIPNFDENHTGDVNYNFWKTNSLTSNTGFTNQVKIVISIDNEYIYSGDVVEFNVDLLDYSVENGTVPLESSVHDFKVQLSSLIGEIENPNIIIRDNKAYFIYSATTIGEEVISLAYKFNLTKYSFDVLDGSDKLKVNATFNILPDKQSIINIIFNESISGNVTIKVNDAPYSVKVENSKAELKINTTPGDYTVKVIYQGDETYRGFIISDKFTVDKFESVLTVENITVYYNGDFKAVLKDDEGNPIKNEIISIKINDTTYTAKTDENGTATLELNLPSVGDYNVVTTFKGNSNFNSSHAKSTIKVEYAYVTLTASENVQITPVKGEFSFTLTDNKNNPLKNTKVIITFNNNDPVEAITDEKGIATIKLNNNGLTVGKYNISAKVVSTPVYSEANFNTSITVIKAIATIKAENITVYANNGELVVYLTDEDGNAINGTNITVKIGKSPTQTIMTDEDGKATMKLELEAGNYTAFINIQENPVYSASPVNAEITVNENILILNAAPITVYYTNGKFKVNVVDITQKPINNIRLIVNINGNDYVTFTNESGVAIVNINLPIGTYPASIKFEGNGIFKPENNVSTVNVVSSISADDLIRAYNSPYDFKATLKDENGNPVVNETINLIVNGKTYTAKTDSEGVLLLSQKLSVGTYAVTIINPLTGEKTANYAQIVNRITGNKNINMYFGAGTSFKVRVFDDDGNPVGAGESVIFTINKKTYTRQTDKNGYASFKITLKAGKYTITATYNGVKVSNKVVVKAVLTAKNISKKKAKTIKFSAKLVNTKGKALKNKKITFKFKGKKYKVKTNKKGVATLSLKNLKVGKYTIKTTYGKLTIKNTIKVKK